MLPMSRLRAQTRNPEHAMWFPRSVSNSVVPFLRSEACKSASAPESVPWQSCELNDRLQVHLRSSTCLWSQLHWDLKSDMQPEQCTEKKKTYEKQAVIPYAQTVFIVFWCLDLHGQTKTIWWSQGSIRIRIQNVPRHGATFGSPSPFIKKGCPVIPLLATKKKSL